VAHSKRETGKLNIVGISNLKKETRQSVNDISLAELSGKENHFNQTDEAHINIEIKKGKDPVVD